ncbi:uncharacterized protein LOC111026465 [Myzus persicae]|nr:uncharacterized protein LOC111026465 [Myzus persicae]
MDPNDVYKKKFICNNHFDEQSFSPGTKRLNAKSCPTLLLPGSTNSKPSQPSVKASISIHQSDSEISGSGTDENIVYSTPAKTHVISNNETLSVDHTNLDDSVMSGFNVLETSVLDEVLTVNTHNVTNAACNADGFYSSALNKSKISKKMKNRSGLLDYIGMNRSLHLTPKCKKFYSITNNLLRKCRRLNNSKQNFKTRLRYAEKFSDSYVNEKFSDKLTAASSLFTNLQLRETKKKSKGHRFTTDEKMLSLTLYKKSPKCYNLLSKLFTLPCKRTLNNILSSVSINPGISPIVMAVLKENVKKLKPKER